MGEYRAVAVPEVKAPHFDVAVGRARRDESRVVAYVQTQHRQLVPVERQVELRREIL